MAHKRGSTFPASPSAAAVSAADTIAGNDDLLTEILVCLPAKPLTQFKSVSKHWLSLISHPQFSLHHARRRRRCKPISALFLNRVESDQEFAFVPFDDGCLIGAPHFRFLAHAGTKILDSCNGLLCYSKLVDITDDSILRYYVCNPTTKQSTRIPVTGFVYDCRFHRGYFSVQHKLLNAKKDEYKPWSELNITLLGVYLAFDPLTSLHYRVVCVWEWNSAVFNYQIKMAVYSSETGLWGELMGPFKVPHGLRFDDGVFWNGRVNWISSRELVCFDIDGGYLETVSFPLNCKEKNVVYFGESRRHLQIAVHLKASNAILNVFEMETDYSCWIAVCGCDLSPVIGISRESVLINVRPAFSLLFLGRAESEDEYFLVIGVSGKIISYGIKNKTSEELFNLPPSSRYKAFPYDETLFEV